MSTETNLPTKNHQDVSSANLPHHIQQELCTTRPLYRQGRKLTAVKVYTVASESQHLFIYGVPKLNLKQELKSTCIKYGQIYTMHVVEDVEVEQFTECYHVHYQRIQSARIAKRFLDNKSFYGSLLHVCYAPEYESIQEMKYKLQLREYDVLKRLYGDDCVNKPTLCENTTKHTVISRKKKHPAKELSKERLVDVDPMIAWKDVPTELDPRIGKNKKVQSMPQKHYLENQDEEVPVKKTKVFVQTSHIIGPQLPAKEDLISENNFIPTQVITSREYKYKEMKTIHWKNNK